jgi:hypothetical protein
LSKIKHEIASAKNGSYGTTLVSINIEGITASMAEKKIYNKIVKT